MNAPHQPDDIDLQINLLDELLDRWEEAHERGEDLSAEALCDGHPELLPQLAARIEQLRRIDGFLGETARAEDTGTTEIPRAELQAVFGDYEILNLIAEGGMGAVYRARQNSPNRIVALKVIRSGESSTSQEIRRFMLEAESAARLSHPGVVPIFEVGEQRGRHFFTMEYVEGRSLSQIVRDNGPIEPREAARMIRDVAEAVHYAHQMGVIHRDLKPANVLIDAHGRARVTDFGIAKQLELDSALTATGQILGTPDFMSPEQARGIQTEIGTTSDVFSLGATLYAVLAGRSPFRASDIYLTIRRVIDEDPPSLRELNPKVDRDLETICLKCLRKNPADRYQTAREFADDLQRYLDGETIRARRTPLAVRATRWIRRHPAVTLASLVAIAGIVFGAFRVLQYYNYERETVAYYQNVERRWQVPTGVGELTPDEASKRVASWRITRRGKYGPIIRAERVNWLLKPQVFSGVRLVRTQRRSEAIWEFEYDTDGNLSKEHAFDHVGHPVWSFIFTAPDRGHFLDQHGLPRTSQGTDLVGVKFEFADDGRLLREMYTDFRGNPRPDEDGVFGNQTEYDGSITVTTTLGPDGKPMLYKSGYVSMRQKQDSNGNVVEEEMLNRDGEVTLSKEGWARRRAEFDEFGRLVSQRYFGLNDEPVTVADGFHERRTHFTESPPSEEHAYFDTDGNAVNCRDGYHRQVGSFNDRGGITSFLTFDQNGKPAVQKDGSAGATWESDDRELPVSMVHVDGKGRPTVNNEGYASWKVKTDDHGNRTEQSYFDENGNPTLVKSGYSIVRQKFNDRDQIVEVSYFDTAGRLTMTTIGYARQVITRDEKGNVVLNELFDAEGKRAYQSLGFTHVRHEFDKYGRRTRLMWYGHDDRPIRTTHGFAGQEFKYDDRGNVIETRWLNTVGRLTLTKQGYAIERKKYDLFGRVVERSYFGLDGELVRSSDGVARNEIAYDDVNHRVDERLFDEKGNLAITAKSGAAHVRDTRDARGNLISREFFGTRKEPIRGPSGFHRIEHQVDARGNSLVARYFDEKGKPMRSRLGEFGQAMKYDARGNIVEYTFLGPDGQPVKTPGGFIRWTQRFDRLGNRLEMIVRDERGNPFAYSPTGIAGSRFRYDRFGNQIERMTVGVDLKPREDKSNAASVRRKYDLHGRVIDERFFDSKGNPAADQMQVHAKLHEFDVRGNEVKTTYLGKDGQPINLYGKWATVTRKYSDFGQSIDQAFFDAEGNKAVHYYHLFHRSTRELDRYGREIDSSKFGIDGKLTNGNAGWARVKTEYDADGWVVRRRYYRADGSEAFPNVIVHSRADPQVAGPLGLRPFDILIAYDGRAITDPSSLRDWRKQHWDNQPRTLTILRGKPGRTLDLPIRPSQELPQLNLLMIPEAEKKPALQDRAPVVARRPRLE